MLVLTLHRARDPGDRQRETRTIDDGTLSIGRGNSNGWILQDPAQHLSKTHCVVAAARSGYTLTDCSSNGTFLNGSKQRMIRDSAVALNDGDEFTLGDYLIQARLVADVSSRAVTSITAAAPRFAPPAIQRDDPFGLDEFLAPQAAPAQPHAPAPPAFDPFADPARSSRLDPFGDDDLLGSPPPRRAFDEPGASLRTPAPDPFEARSTSLNSAAPVAGNDPFGADDDLFRGATPAVQWQGPSQPDAIDAVHGAFLPPKSIIGAPADAWDDLLGDTPPGSPPVAASPPPAPPPPPQPSPQPSAAPPPPAREPAAEPSRLVAAFLEGAGVPDIDVSKQDPEQYMRAAGALFGLMVESLRDVLMSRAAVKSEFGLDQTMLRPRENNALKFSITPADAIAALLQPGKPGYMDPLRATREAFDDVRVHQVAVMAGVQAALFNLLRTFDPVALESRLQKGGMIESLLPGTRRAKLWEAFVATYKEIARDADADFQDVFGREFARAYNQQAKNE